jgi:hypothetical protein
MRFGVFLFILLMACGSPEPHFTFTVSDFFPVKVGGYFIYNVDSVVTNQTIETAFSYQVRILISDSFPNSDGGYSYIMSRSKRKDSISTWSSLGSWSVRVNTLQAVVNEGNIPYLKIEGPVISGKAWNGNELNAMIGKEKCLEGGESTCDIYTVQYVTTGYTTMKGVDFPTTITVNENNDDGEVTSKDIRSEVYALHVGLVSREILQLTYCTKEDCLGQKKIDKGLRYAQKLKEYGGI